MSLAMSSNDKKPPQASKRKSKSITPDNVVHEPEVLDPGSGASTELKSKPGTVSKIPPQNVPKAPPITYTAPEQTLLDRLKAYAWRMTGIYGWFHFLLNFFGLHALITIFEESLVSSLMLSLRNIGFSPSRADYFLLLLKISWVLIITGARPIQLLFLIIYNIIFPIVLLGLIFITLLPKGTSENNEQSAKSSKEKLNNKRKKYIRFNFLTFMLFFQASWFILYGDTISMRQSILGAFIACLTFCVYAVKIFQRVIPIGHERGIEYSWLQSLNKQLLRISSKSNINNSSNLKDADEAFDKTQMLQWVVRKITFFCRGTYMRRIVSYIVFAEYVATLLILLLLSILSWTLIVKAANPSQIPFNEALHFTFSHFFSAIKSQPLQTNIPYWIEVGTVATSWVILAIYVAFSNSQVRDWQRANMVNLKSIYSQYRTTTLAIRKELRRINKIKKTKEPEK